MTPITAFCARTMTALVLALDIVPGVAGYTYRTSLARAWHGGHMSRMWALGTRPVSGEIRSALGGGLWKSWDTMPTLTTELLDQLEAIGVMHPSSFADCYHQLAPSIKRVKHTYNGMFRWWHGGPWEEARRKGSWAGHWYRYDLRSAYRWAASLGLPDTQTFHACIHKRPADTEGLWVGYVEPRADLPNVFRQAKYPVVMSSEEIRGYGVLFDVIRGVTWTDVTPSDYIDKTLALLPCAKDASRAFWGKWISRDPLRCWTRNKKGTVSTWDMPNRSANFVWGWLVVGRVRLKVWQASQESAHVYVDEVLVPHELPVGDGVGDWHLKEEYTSGIQVRRTGWYGALGGNHAMQTGVRLN